MVVTPFEIKRQTLIPIQSRTKLLHFFAMPSKHLFQLLLHHMCRDVILLLSELALLKSHFVGDVSDHND